MKYFRKGLWKYGLALINDQKGHGHCKLCSQQTERNSKSNRRSMSTNLHYVSTRTLVEVHRGHISKKDIMYCVSYGKVIFGRVPREMMQND